MIATMERSTMIPFRWLGRRLDIHTCIVDGQPLFLADDVCAALDAHVEVEHDDFMGIDYKTFPGSTRSVPGLVGDDNQPLQFFTIEVVRRLADERPMYVEQDQGEFLDWFEDLLEQMSNDGLEQLAAGSVPAQPGLRQGESYSVARAAKVLAEHLGSRFGQQALFASLESLGWISRVNERWTAAPELLASGHLVTQIHRVGPVGQPYEQVRVTPSGLELLNVLLRPQPVLVDL